MKKSIIAVLLAAFGLAACGEGGAPATGSDAAGSVSIVAGFYPLAEAAERVGGDAVEVTNLTPAGAEAHDLELTTDQLDAVLDADLVLLLGSGFQPALESAVEQREGLTLDLLDSQARDPHVWLDPGQFAEIATEIGAALGELVGDDDSISERTQTYVSGIRALDQDFEEGLDRCMRREFVTTHDAFGHLADAYRLQQESIGGLSPEAEPDPARLAELADRISETGATTVFTEPLAPDGAARALARDTGVTTKVLDPLESLRPAQVEAGDDYESVMRANLAALREGLDCQ